MASLTIWNCAWLDIFVLSDISGSIPNFIVRHSGSAVFYNKGRQLVRQNDCAGSLL